jgi:hypothetical protein
MMSITRKLIRELHKGSIALSCPAETDTRGRAGDRSLVHRFGAAPFFVIGVGAIFFLIPVFINGFPLVFSDSVDYLVYTPHLYRSPFYAAFMSLFYRNLFIWTPISRVCRNLRPRFCGIRLACCLSNMPRSLLVRAGVLSVPLMLSATAILLNNIVIQHSFALFPAGHSPC